MPSSRSHHSLRTHLDATFQRVDALHGLDLEIQSDFARYLCVLTSGYVEAAVEIIAFQYCVKRASPEVSNYAETQLSRLQNMSPERLGQLLGSFDTKWRIEFESFVDGRRKDA